MRKCHPTIPQHIDDQLSPEARAFFRDLIDDYERRIKELTSQIDQPKPTPENSSVPPSVQHPHGKGKPKKKKAKPTTAKKRGGQPGHAKVTRALIPTADCDHIEPLLPRQCRKCGQRLKGKDPEPLRHQVFELPVIKPIVTEYQRQRLTCERRSYSINAHATEIHHSIPTWRHAFFCH
jgi:transposase